MVWFWLGEIFRVDAECKSLKLRDLSSPTIDVSLIVWSLSDREVHSRLVGPRHGDILESADKEGILLRLEEKLENHHYHIRLRQQFALHRCCFSWA